MVERSRGSRSKLAALRRSLLALIAAVALFPALRWFVAPPTTFEATVYGLGVVTVTAFSLVPALVRRSFAGVALPLALTYVVVRFFLAGQGVSATVLMVETLSVIGLSWLVHRVFAIARSLGEEDGNQLALEPEVDARLEAARRQFLLARRHARPLSCIAIDLDRESLNEQLEAIPSRRSRSFLETYAWQWAAKVAAEAARRSDVTLEANEPRRLLLLCPETSNLSAARVATKISRALSAHLGLEALIGIASYPSPALTLEELVDDATSAIGGHNPMQLPIHFPDKPASAVDASEPPSHAEGENESTKVGWAPGALEPPVFAERAGWMAKRAMDVCLVVLFSPLWLLLLAVVAIVVKIDSPRDPVFFTQMRVGRWGRRFPMFKFRTMVSSSERLKTKLREQSEMSWPDFKVKRDPRITRVGRLLRQTSLDELPQLVNVLRGDMSLVGPRPTSFSDDTYALWQKARLAVPPGLTGLWQIGGRGSSDFEHRARMDISYIERRSLVLDLWILMRTAAVVVNRKGGY